jgi:hypothetical protein
MIGIDFPIPLTILMRKPTYKPASDGPNYQKYWAKSEPDAKVASVAITPE